MATPTEEQFYTDDMETLRKLLVASISSMSHSLCAQQVLEVLESLRLELRVRAELELISAIRDQQNRTVEGSKE